MPYIITTTTPGRSVAVSADASYWVADGVTRTAVATLDEARTSAFRQVVEHWPGKRVGEGPNLTRLPESGGTVGPLPDGTVIEVRPVGWFDFERMAVPEDAADVDIATFDSDQYRDGLIAAFNAS